MRLSDKIYRMMQQSRERIIKTMQERGITKVNLIMTQEEFAKENGFDDVEQAEEDYYVYRNQEAPYVIYFDKWGCGRDYAAMSVELVDGEHPEFKLNCYNNEEGSDTFYDYDLTNLSMVNVYERMLEELEELEPEYVWVFVADQVCNDDNFDVITEVFATEEAARQHLHEFVHGEEGELAYAEKHGWVVEHNEPDLFRSYEDGYYSGNHTEATIEKREVKH